MTTYTCNNNILNTTQKSCSANAICSNNGISTQSQCICKTGFTGDGYTCIPSNNLIKYSE